MKLVSDISANVLKCDAKDCPETFRSYSVHTLLRKQAASKGWIRKKKQDRCPAHRNGPWS